MGLIIEWHLLPSGPGSTEGPRVSGLSRQARTTRQGGRTVYRVRAVYRTPPGTIFEHFKFESQPKSLKVLPPAISYHKSVSWLVLWISAYVIVIERLSAKQFNNENENPDATWSPPTDKTAPAVGAKRKSGSWRECEDVQELRNIIEKQEQLLAKRDLKCKNLQQARRLFSRGMAMHAFFT